MQQIISYKSKQVITLAGLSSLPYRMASPKTAKVIVHPQIGPLVKGDFLSQNTLRSWKNKKHKKNTVNHLKPKVTIAAIKEDYTVAELYK